MKPGQRSCETCPHRLPMDRESWAKVAKAQRQATPHLSRSQSARLTKIDRKMFEGLEANVEQCEGWNRIQGVANYFLRKVSVEHAIKRTEAGGTRSVSWHERTCRNPFLESPEYFALEDDFRNVDPDSKSSMFKTDRQREAFIEDNAAMQRTIGGIGIAGVGMVLAGASSDVEGIIGGTLIGPGLYLAYTGATRLFRALAVQLQEHRDHQE